MSFVFVSNFATAKLRIFQRRNPWSRQLATLIMNRLFAVFGGGDLLVFCWRRIFKEILVQDHFYRKYSWNHKFFELDLCLPLLMMNDGAIAMVADSEQRLSVRLCAEWTQLVRSNTHHFWMYIIDHRIDELHFDDRAVDAVFEQTLSLVILLSFGCLSPHSEGAIIFYEKHLFLERNKLKEPTAQHTNDDTLYFRFRFRFRFRFWFSDSDSPILRFSDFWFPIPDSRSELI